MSPVLRRLGVVVLLCAGCAFSVGAAIEGESSGSPARAEPAPPPAPRSMPTAAERIEQLAGEVRRIRAELYVKQNPPPPSPVAERRGP